MRIVVVSTAVLATLMIGACGAFYDFERVRALDPKSDDHNAHLAREYRTLALYEEDEMYDHIDAVHFARKAERAAAGESVDPERLEDWRLPDKERGQLAQARVRLVKVIDAGARDADPATAATAISRFDCWVEQQEENWQWAHIAKCRDEFHAALTELESDMAMLSQERMDTAAGEPAATTPPVKARAAPPPRTLTVLFGFDSATIESDVRDQLRQAIRLAQPDADLTIEVAGHADRAGPSAYNDDLALKRAKAVQEVITEAGVSDRAVRLVAFGERRPTVPTGDGVPERRNRRVEIRIESNQLSEAPNQQ